MSNESIDVSVVLPTYNREAVGPLCLEKLATSHLPLDLMEVLVVEDPGTDGMK